MAAPTTTIPTRTPAYDTSRFDHIADGDEDALMAALGVAPPVLLGPIVDHDFGRSRTSADAGSRSHDPSVPGSSPGGPTSSLRDDRVDQAMSHD